MSDTYTVRQNHDDIDVVKGIEIIYTCNDMKQAQRAADFLNAAAKAEREACAKVCDEQAKEPECPERAQYCAAAIRARGEG